MKRQPINKDNYEEYFLLYVDNELTAVEKMEVDSFIEKNPGLKMELQMFLGTRLELEEVKMEDLEELYRHSGQGLISQESFEEFQLLSIDNELNEDEEKAIEKYNGTHAEAAANFEWLKKTKLPVEHIAFPNKHSLYRAEKKTATTISIQWFRYAAAAVLLLAGLFWLNNKEEGISAVIDRPVARVETPAETKNADSSKTGTVIGESNNKVIIEKTAETNAEEQTKNITIAVTETTANPSTETELKQPKALQQKTVSKNKKLTGVDLQQIAAVEKNETKIRTEDLLSQQTTESMTTPVPFVQPAVAMDVKTNYAAEALNGEHRGELSESIQEENRQRKGLRGIVRKANRIYNKVTNPDIDKPLVKVANFEIGLPR
jgi:hypothetical protein